MSLHTWFQPFFFQVFFERQLVQSDDPRFFNLFFCCSFQQRVSMFPRVHWVSIGFLDFHVDFRHPVIPVDFFVFRATGSTSFDSVSVLLPDDWFRRRGTAGGRGQGLGGG